MKKRFLCVLLSLSFIFSTIGMVVAEEVTSDYVLDSSTKTYTVYTDAGFQAVAGLINGGNYSYNISLAENITLSAPVNIGTSSSNPYSGTINGNGYTLSGVVANTTATDGQALVLYSGGMTVKNLNLKVNIDAGTNAYVAGFLYKNVSGATFENCSVQGTLSGASHVAGFIAHNTAVAKLTDCSAHITATASGNYAAGMIAQSSAKATISGCEVYACTISSAVYAGGFVALSSGALYVDNSTAHGVELTGTGNYVGGVLGRLSGTYFSCNNVAVEATISAASYSGGILGGDGYSSSSASDTSTYPKIILKNIVTAGNYTSTTAYTGGFVGYNVNINLTLENCVSFADLTAPDYAGGYAPHLRGGVLNFTNCIYAGDISCTGTYKGNVTAYVEIKNASQTAAFTNCYVWGASNVIIATKTSIDSSVTPVITVNGTSSSWSTAKASYLSAAGVKSRISNYMKDFNDDLVSLAEYCQSEYTKAVPGALAISEIANCPANAAYEYIEVINTSDSNVALDGYTIVRNACANTGVSQRNVIQRLMGTSSSLTPSNIASLEIKNTGIVLAPNEVAILWIVSYGAKTKNISDFKTYWNGLGNDLSSTQVARIPQYIGNANRFHVQSINSKCGNGFLPDKYSACTISLVNAENSAKRISNGSTLSNLCLPMTQGDTNMLLSLSDSFAMFFTETAAKTGYVYNYYDYLDEEAHREALSDYTTTLLQEQDRIYPLTIMHNTMVTGQLDGNGLPSMHNYVNITDTTTYYTPYIDGGTLNSTPTPGKLISDQHLNIDFSGLTVVDSDTIQVTGYAKNTRFQQVGFTVYTKSPSGIIKNLNKQAMTSTVASNGKFTLTLDSFPVADGDIVVMIPCGIDASGIISTGKHTEIKYPQKSVKLYSSYADTIRITYFSSSEEKSDYTGYYEAAKLFAEDLQYYTGKDVALTPFEKHASYRQIVFCSPTAAAAFMPSSLSIGTNNYAIFGKFGNVFIVAGNAMAAEYASQTIINTVKTATDVVDLLDFCTGTASTFTHGTHKLPLTDGADFRIMTFNVERYELNQNLDRITDFVNTIKYYSSDVVGFQEYCATFTSNLTPKLQSMGYTVLGNDVSGGVQNYTPLAYKTSRFNCIDRGWFKLSGESNYPGHNVTWAVLQDKTSGDKFAVSTTHFFHLSDRTQADPVRAINAREILDLTKNIVAKHNCAVINMGDYNTYTTDVGYPEFLTGNVLQEARFTSERDIFLQRTSHADGSSAASSGSLTMALDLFFVTDLTRVVRFKCPMNMTTASASDHFPTFVDIAASSTSDYKLDTLPGSGVTLEKSGSDSIIRVPLGTSESELLSVFGSNAKLSGAVATGGKVVNYVGSTATDHAYIVIENDVNGDGVINGKDIVRAKKYALGMETNKINIMAADKDGNGKISDAEVSELIDIVSGIE